MAGRIGGWRRAAALAAVAAAGAASLTAMPPGRAAAAEPSEPHALPGSTVAAITADIDDDGDRELVRLVSDDGLLISLEAWDVVDERWTRVLAAGGDGLAPDGGPVEAGRTAASLVNARVDGRDRVVLLTATLDPSDGRPCCLTMHQVVAVEGAGYEVEPTSTVDVAAEAIAVIDLDGDGTDELAASAIDWSEGGSADALTHLTVLRWTGTSWGTLAAWSQPGSWFGLMPADTDGIPGLELLATGGSDELLRLAWINGTVTESMTVGLFGREGGYIAGTLGELLIHVGPETVSLLSWPRGQQSRVVATRRVVGFPAVGVVGNGPDALVLVHEGFELGRRAPSTTVLDANLEPLGEVPFREEARALWTASMSDSEGWLLGRFLAPSFGALSGGIAGPEPAYLVGGMVVQRDGDTFEARPVTPVVGHPIGPIGPADGWVALVDLFPWVTGTYLQSGPVSPDSRTVLLPAARLTDPGQVSRPVAEVTLEGAYEAGRDDDVVRIVASPAGMAFVVHAPPGTLAIAWDGASVRDPRTVDGLTRIEVPPPRGPDPDREYTFEQLLILIGPDGNASVNRWEGTFAPERPELTAWTEAEPLSLEAIVAGRASPDSTVTVDGRPAPLNEFDAYRMTVDAPPWPRDVVVVARDPFGGEQRSTVQVIGLVDYRGLPWAPIAGGVTVLAALLLFLRTPRHRPSDERPALDDGRLEDLDGDLV